MESARDAQRVVRARHRRALKGCKKHQVVCRTCGRTWAHFSELEAFRRKEQHVKMGHYTAIR